MEKDSEMHDTMIGVDLAKRVFHLHVASMTGHLKERKKLTPLQFRRYMADAPKCVVVFEACGSAHYWAREMMELGHEARITSAQYVKPFSSRDYDRSYLQRCCTLHWPAGTGRVASLANAVSRDLAASDIVLG